MIGIQGWAEGNKGSKKFSQMAKNKNSRNEFITSVLEFLEMYKFQGLDLDWYG